MIEWQKWSSCVPAGWPTFIAVLVISCSYVIGAAIRFFLTRLVLSDHKSISSPTPATYEIRQKITINDEDLEQLMRELQYADTEEDPSWESVVEKKSDTVSYVAKRRDPKDGGVTQYLSTTIFENIGVNIVRDFYMDSDFRKEWDKTLVQHKQLEIHLSTGLEIGQILKKFPLLSPREYVMAWRLWKGKDESSYYCVLKACEHMLAPIQTKYKRVEAYNSGWCIRAVPGSNACEIKMLHQEDIGMRRDMAKLAFSRGIWSYVKKMEVHLRQYALRPTYLHKGINAVALAQQVPQLLMQKYRIGSSENGMQSRSSLTVPAVNKRWSRRRLAKGLLFLGGAIVLMQGKSSVGGKLATAYFVNKFVRPQKCAALKSGSRGS